MLLYLILLYYDVMMTVSVVDSRVRMTDGPWNIVVWKIKNENTWAVNWTRQYLTMMVLFKAYALMSFLLALIILIFVITKKELADDLREASEILILFIHWEYLHSRHRLQLKVSWFGCCWRYSVGKLKSVNRGKLVTHISFGIVAMALTALARTHTLNLT